MALERGLAIPLALAGVVALGLGVFGMWDILASTRDVFVSEAEVNTRVADALPPSVLVDGRSVRLVDVYLDPYPDDLGGVGLDVQVRAIDEGQEVLVLSSHGSVTIDEARGTALLAPSVPDDYSMPGRLVRTHLPAVDNARTDEQRHVAAIYSAAMSSLARTPIGEWGASADGGSTASFSRTGDDARAVEVKEREPVTATYRESGFLLNVEDGAGTSVFMTATMMLAGLISLGWSTWYLIRVQTRSREIQARMAGVDLTKSGR